MGRSADSGMSWSEQWGAHSNSTGDAPFASGTPIDPSTGKAPSKSGKKMKDVKAAASVGLEKAKGAASVGAEKAKIVASVGAEKAKVGALKVKSGTVSGFKWLKEQYSKRTSK